MKGAGTDDVVLVNILCKRTIAQLQVLKTAYKAQLGRDLEHDIHSETSHHFRDTILGCLMDTPTYDSYIFRHAMAGLGTTETTLVEMLSTRTKAEIAEIDRVYKALYNHTLENQISNETSGDLRKALLALFSQIRVPQPTQWHKMLPGSTKPEKARSAQMKTLSSKSCARALRSTCSK